MVPWVYKSGLRYGFRFFVLPPAGYAHPDWSILCVEWIGIAVIYAGLRALLKSASK